MRRLYLLPMLLVLAPAASAETTIVVDPKERPAPVAGATQVRVSVGVNMFVPAPNDNSEQMTKAQEAARRAIYQIGAKECELLRETIASECQLESINVNLQSNRANQFGNQQQVEGFNVNSNIGFRVVPK